MIMNISLGVNLYYCVLLVLYMYLPCYSHNVSKLLFIQLMWLYHIKYLNIPILHLIINNNVLVTTKTNNVFIKSICARVHVTMKHYKLFTSVLSLHDQSCTTTTTNNNNNNIYLKSNIHSIIRYKFSGLYNGIKHGIHIKTVQCI